MGKNENASPPVVETGGRRAEKEAARRLIPQLHCIIVAGGVQSVRRRAYHDRLVLYGMAKMEYEMLQATGLSPCGYDSFTHNIAEVLRI